MVFFFFILVVNIEYLVFNGFVMVNVWVFYIEIIGFLFVEGDYFLVYINIIRINDVYI